MSADLQDKNGEKAMRNNSAVQFATNRRIHIALAVKDLAKSVEFYRLLFGLGPTKTRLGYAKFEVADPAVNLSLNEVAGETAPSNVVAHFGIQVKGTDIVEELGSVFTVAGLPTRAEENVTCCYAVQDKVWVTDPDGNKWEVFVVLDNDGAHHESSAEPCCNPKQCCVPVGAK